jgi:hypothetical protein
MTVGLVLKTKCEAPSKSATAHYLSSSVPGLPCTSKQSGIAPIPAGSVPENVPDGGDVLFSEHLHETGDTLAFYLFEGFEVPRCRLYNSDPQSCF